MKIRYSIIFSTVLLAAFIVTKSIVQERGAGGGGAAVKIPKKSESAKAGWPDAAARWYYEQRAFPSGVIPADWRSRAFEHIERENTSPLKNTMLTWTALGPGNIGGRIRSIAIHPTQTNIIYIGSVSGGIWKTTNSGTSWTPLKDNMANLAVCALAIHPNNANEIYAGTGEGFYNIDAIRGEGIFKSTDAGATWTQLPSTLGANAQNFYYVNKLEYDRTTNTLWAGTRKGLFKSTDGGQTFITVLSSGSGDSHCMDIEIAPATPTLLYATFGLFTEAEVYRSTDAGANWTPCYSKTGMGRAEIGISKSNPQTAYISFMDLSSNQAGHFAKTTNGGASWTQVAIPGPSVSGSPTYTSNQAWFNNIVAVSPTDPSTVYAGGLDLWRSINGGTSWTQITNWYSGTGLPPYVHADFHAIAFDPLTPTTFYLGTDGGMSCTTNAGGFWVDLNNNLSITQFYHGAMHPSSSTYYGGTQDNGNIKSTGTANWFQLISGDGGAFEVDYNTPATCYAEYVYFTFFKSLDGGNSFVKAMNGIPTGPGQYDGTTDRTQFITPFIMDPNDPSILLGGTYRVWKTTNKASSWAAISGDLTGDGTGTSGATITALAVAKGNSNVIYAGCSNGRAQVTTNNGALWNVRSSGLPALYCTRIAVHPTDPATAYACFSGYSAGQKVYKTTNYGVNWSSISSNLPNIPVNCIIVNPNDPLHLFVGTDLGIFSTLNGGGAWMQEANGMPNVAVSDLDYRASDKKLFAATHGRGMFAAPIQESPGGTLSLVYDDGNPATQYYWGTAGQASANRMTPPAGTYDLIGMSIYIAGVRTGTATYKPIVLSANSGIPGSALASLNSTTFAAYPGWHETDLTPKSIRVSSEFFVGLQYDGINQPAFGADPVNNNRAWDYNGFTWASWSETYFMRATLRNASSVITLSNQIPSSFFVSNNFPNPFNPSTTFHYGLPRSENVNVTVYDMQGRKVATLAEGVQAPGTYSITWNGLSSAGTAASAGTYIIAVTAGPQRIVKKVLMLK